VAVGYLRAFSRLLVFALHSIVAYFAIPFTISDAVFRFSFPVLDPHDFGGARILVAFNEISLMSLLFFLSGLFLWPSLSRKGASAFLRERVVRLALPFLFCGVAVAAVAYYPSYLLSTPRHPSLADYFGRFMTPGHWMTGPGWFLLILFLFDLVAIAAFVFFPGWGRMAAALAADARARPLRFFALVACVSALAYVPFAYALGPYEWWGYGLFWLQKCRPLQYAAYFFFGVSVGAFGLSRGLLAPDGALARRWAWWAMGAVPAFLVAGNLIGWVARRHLDRDLLWGGLADFGWVLCCAVSTFALLAVFVRFARRNRIIDNFADNSYGMYLVHYMFVTWTQFALLPLRIDPIEKWLIVLAVTIVASWTLAATLRRIPAIGHNI